MAQHYYLYYLILCDDSLNRRWVKYVFWGIEPEVSGRVFVYGMIFFFAAKKIKVLRLDTR